MSAPSGTTPPVVSITTYKWIACWRTFAGGDNNTVETTGWMAAKSGSDVIEKIMTLGSGQKRYLIGAVVYVLRPDGTTADDPVAFMNPDAIKKEKGAPRVVEETKNLPVPVASAAPAANTHVSPYLDLSKMDWCTQRDVKQGPFPVLSVKEK